MAQPKPDPSETRRETGGRLVTPSSTTHRELRAVRQETPTRTAIPAVRPVPTPTANAPSAPRRPAAPEHPTRRDLPATRAGTELRPVLAPPRPNSHIRQEMPAVHIQPYDPDPDEDDEWDSITSVTNSIPVIAGAERTVLVRLDGVEAGSLVALTLGSGTTLGRHAASDTQIHDAGVSRQHARIEWVAGRHEVVDLGSANGTWINGQRVSRRALADGDLLQLGPNVCFRYTRTNALHEGLLREQYESSTRDALSGAYNRRHFDERLKAELAYANRHGTTLSIVLLDIDHFKRVNDEFGHAVGDQVIRHIATLAARELRSEDVFCRWGGEEFAILLRATLLRDAVRVAERVRATIERLPMGHVGRPLLVTVSAGCAELDECPSRSAAELMQRVDERLYAAKHRGRNQVVGLLR